MNSPENPGDREIFVEFIAQGAFVKASAIDSKSGTEACVLGPANAPRSTLADAAVRKLNFVLKKQRDDR